MIDQAPGLRKGKHMDIIGSVYSLAITVHEERAMDFIKCLPHNHLGTKAKVNFSLGLGPNRRQSQLCLFFMMWRDLEYANIFFQISLSLSMVFPEAF